MGDETQGGYAYEPEDYGGTVSTSVQQTETSSSVQLGIGFFFILWTLLLVLVMITLRALCKHTKRQSGGATARSFSEQLPRQQQITGDDEEVASQHNHQQPVVDETAKPTAENLLQNNYPHTEAESSSLSVALVIISLSSLVALPFSLVSLITCKFMDVENDDTFLETVGLWSFSVSYEGNMEYGLERNVCHSSFRYSDVVPVSASLKFARTASVVATVVGAFLSIVALVSVCRRNTTLLRCWMSWWGLVLAMCQWLTLLVGNSQSCTPSCWVDIGALSAITAGGYWFLCALGFCLLQEE